MAEARRHKYLIDKKFQISFIVKFCSLVVLGGALTVLSLYFFSSSSTTVSIVDSRVVVRTTADFLMPVLIQTVSVVMIIVGILAIGVTLFFSHKISGPMYRLRSIMEGMAKGDLRIGFSIRRLDQLQGMADALNEVLHSMKQSITAIQKASDQINAKVNSLSGFSLPEDKQKDFDELKKLSQELKDLLHHFKV
ncbi:MAG: methyl-accepting chemotaxis protein [Candidatus Omnitrophica bacterium]|jgi:methyl-accepting chemotaxis protein|nr:methyl-accepting chemotaxis protein [Candidatus Omnitrophota bacterium]